MGFIGTYGWELSITSMLSVIYIYIQNASSRPKPAILISAREEMVTPLQLEDFLGIVNQGYREIHDLGYW